MAQFEALWNFLGLVYNTPLVVDTLVDMCTISCFEEGAGPNFLLQRHFM